MKALNSVILSTKRSYNNKENLNGTEYTVNVSIDNVESINREAVVISAPKNTSLKSGDVVIVHHNIMRENIHNNGSKDKGQFHISGSYYQCPYSEVILKKGEDGEWETLHDFVFIKPIKQENISIGHGLTLIPRSRKGMVELRAELAISNKKLKSIKKGDVVVFSINSEHEFIIDGEKLYKCEIEDLLGVDEK